MRKCDICHSTIPNDQNVCPNCGAQYREETTIQTRTQEINKEEPKKQRSKRSFNQRGNSLLRIVILGVILFLWAPRFIHHVIKENIDISQNEQLDEAEFDSYASLNEHCPDIAQNNVLVYYEHIIDFNFEHQDVFEKYKVENGQLVYADISFEIAEENSRYIFRSYNFSGHVWYETVKLCVEDFSLQNFHSHELDLLATYSDLDVNELYKTCIDLYKLMEKNQFRNTEIIHIGDISVTGVLEEEEIVFKVEKMISE